MEMAKLRRNNAPEVTFAYYNNAGPVKSMTRVMLYDDLGKSAGITAMRGHIQIGVCSAPREGGVQQERRRTSRVPNATNRPASANSPMSCCGRLANPETGRVLDRR
jgi:hypothetical protein